MTQEEACSVLIGLQALAAIPAPERKLPLEQAIKSLATVAGKDAWLADAVGLHLVSGTEMENVAALQRAIQHGRACAITYLVRHRDELSERTVEPLRLFSVDTTWYLRAWCRKAGSCAASGLIGSRTCTTAVPKSMCPANRWGGCPEQVSTILEVVTNRFSSLLTPPQLGGWRLPTTPGFLTLVTVWWACAS
ncbi:WYL domain-containing protein [Arthrobacter alpinus]|nr:WYL domain-containing protein [Arthrobacter alpinus]